MLRIWWDTVATTWDQTILLVQAGLGMACAGVPWAFLPARVQTILAQTYAWTGHAVALASLEE